MQLWTAFVHTGWVGKTVLGILLAFSVLSWATIIIVWRRFRRSEHASRRFITVFRKAKRLADVQTASAKLAHSALSIKRRDDNRRNNRNETGNQSAKPGPQAKVEKSFHNNLAGHRSGER